MIYFSFCAVVAYIRVYMRYTKNGAKILLFFEIPKKISKKYAKKCILQSGVCKCTLNER